MKRSDDRSMVERMFAVLEVVAAEPAGELGLRELARRADLSPATASRLVAACAKWGGLERTDSGGVQLGL